MQSSSSALCVLILLTTTSKVSESAVAPVKVNLHDSATLPCSERCSGLVRWTVFHKPTDVLAECNQTSCRSKEGYQMIHDQCLKGNLSLTITDADFTKRGRYMSDCDGKDLCDVHLQIELSELAVAPVKVNLHDSATLPCSERCSGLVRWTVFHKPTDVLAECNQTSCRSVKEGYQMIQYLKGNLSLTITDADFTKRGWYTCDCDGKDLCDVNLQIEPLNTTVQIEPGESLVLELDISDPVEVLYNSTDAAGPSSGQICTVDGHSTQCREEYKERVSAALELRAVTPSDSGVYTVMDERTDEVIHTYTVTVGSAGGRGDRPDLDKGAAVPAWSFTLIAVLLVVCAVSVVVIVRLKREIQQLRMKTEVLMNGPCDRSLQMERLSPPSNVQAV